MEKEKNSEKETSEQPEGDFTTQWSMMVRTLHVDKDERPGRSRSRPGALGVNSDRPLCSASLGPEQGVLLATEA